MAVAAHGRGWVAQLAAVRAALDEQLPVVHAVPEPLVGRSGSGREYRRHLVSADLFAGVEHDLLFFELRDLVGVEVDLAQDLARVHSRRERWALDHARCLRHVEHEPELVHLPDQRVLVLRDPTALQDLGVVEEIEHEVGRRHLDRHAGTVEDAEPLGRGLAREHRFELGVEGIVVVLARASAAAKRAVGREVVTPDGRAQRTASATRRWR